MMLAMLAAHSAVMSSGGCRRPNSSVGAAPIYLLLALGWGLMPSALAASGLHIALDQFGTAGGLFTFALWFAWCLRERRLPRLAAALEALTLFYAICMTVTLMTFVAGTSHRAFFDASLAQADRALLPMFDWPDAMLAFSRLGLPVRIANQIYESIGWQPQLLVITLAFTGAYHRMWYFLVSWITTLCIVVVVFALYPVLGAYAYFGIAAADVPAVLDPTPWNQPLLLDGLREGTLTMISLGKLDGIVNYPSFHAGAAVLLTCGFWPMRVLRWPFAILNMLMLLSAIPIGGHYVVDLLAGMIAAAAGMAGATWIIGCSGSLLTSLASSPRFARRETFSSNAPVFAADSFSKGE